MKVKLCQNTTLVSEQESTDVAESCFNKGFVPIAPECSVCPAAQHNKTLAI